MGGVRAASGGSGVASSRFDRVSFGVARGPGTRTGCCCKRIRRGRGNAFSPPPHPRSRASPTVELHASPLRSRHDGCHRQHHDIHPPVQQAEARVPCGPPGLRAPCREVVRLPPLPHAAAAAPPRGGAPTGENTAGASRPARWRRSAMLRPPGTTTAGGSGAELQARREWARDGRRHVGASGLCATRLVAAAAARQPPSHHQPARRQPFAGCSLRGMPPTRRAITSMTWL